VRRVRKRWFALCALLGLIVVLPINGTPAVAAGAGGPVIIMGIDADDGGPGGHGPIAVYDTIVDGIYGQTTNGGSGIVVFGSGRAPGDSPTTFWDQIATDTGKAVTHVNGDANVASQSLSGFAVIAITTSDQATSGGLSDTESEALKLRSFEIAQFVNAGGGLIVFTQNGQTTPYGFLGDLGTFVSDDLDVGSSDDITPTAAGLAAGVTDDLDVCCWHHQFTTFPSYLTVLATYTGSTEVAAIGGTNVQIPTGIVLDPATQTHFVGENCTVTATITENQLPVAGRDVRFSLTGGPNAPQAATVVSDAAGKAVFSYAAVNPGTDTIVAEFTDSQARVRVADVVTCVLAVPPPTTTTTTAPVVLPVAQPVAARPSFTG
jgi:hypothetical protein